MRDNLYNGCHKERGQGMVEFALVLPLLLVVMFGLIEAGRLLFIYSVVFTSTREAARYGSAAGFLSGNTYQYQDCAGIRSAAKRVGSIAGIQDSNITITYDRVTPSGVSQLGTCPVGSTGPRLTLGNRVTVRTSINYQPLVPVPNLPSFPIVSVSSRTILKDVSIEGEQSGGPSSLPTVFFFLEQPTEQEEDIPAEWFLKVRLSNTVDEPVTVNFSLAGSATPVSDYSINHTSQVTIPRDTIEATIHITAVADTTYEDNETISLTMESTINAVRGSPYIMELAIIDDDGPPMVSFQAAAQDVGEHYPQIRIPVQLNHPSELDTQVTFSLSGTADEYIDYTPPALTLTIPAGATSAEILIPLIDDILYDPNETVVATLESVVNGTITEPSVHTATIFDNDVEPAVSFVLDSQSATEATGMVLITAVLRRGLQEVVAGLPVTVPFSIGGTAVSPDDYNYSPSPLVIPAGSSRADIVVTLVNDGIAELDETVIVTMGTPTNADLGMPSVHTLTITSTPTVYFTLASQSVHEDPSRALNIEVRLLPTQTVPVSVPFILSGTAQQGQDYTMGTSSPLVFPAGATSANITINLISDSVYEGNESVVIELGNPTNAILGEPNVHTLTILNDTPLPVVSFALPDQSVEENVGNASVQVQLDIASSLPVTVPLTLGGSATPGFDYIFNQTQVIVPPGSLGLPLSVQIIDDTQRELDETILLSMGPPGNAVLGNPGAHTITILRSDWPTCTINDENPLVFDPDGYGVNWTLNNTGTDELVLRELTISWPTGAPNAPKLDQVLFGPQMVFDGNEPHSPYTVTNWLGFESYRILSTSGSTVDLRFTRSLDPGSYVLTLIFHNNTRGVDCSAVTQSRSRP